MMVRVCPKRDAQCPHGENCSFVIDRYNCAPEPSPPMTNPMELAGRLRDPTWTNEQHDPKATYRTRPVAFFEEAATFIEAQAVQLAERDAKLTAERSAVVRLIHRAETADALLQRALEGVAKMAKFSLSDGSEGDGDIGGTLIDHDDLILRARALSAAIQLGDSHER